MVNGVCKVIRVYVVDDSRESRWSLDVHGGRSILNSMGSFTIVSILPSYDIRIFPAEIPLPVCCKIRSRSVETNKVNGRSGTSTTPPSNLHSGLDASFGSCTFRDIGCYRVIVQSG
jgi:hypothetical protein